jgi:hypothetical protein
MGNPLNDSTDRLQAFRDLIASRKAAEKAKAKAKTKKATKVAPAEPAPPPPPPWTDTAVDFIKKMQSDRRFTSDDVALAIGAPPPAIKAGKVSYNAMGALLHRASKDGLIEDTGDTVPAASPKARGRRIRVWRRVAGLGS